ncbi:unknown [Prevotella sp. CAG:732]|nr:unknown [Prevotella sp. CAG:732]
MKGIYTGVGYLCTRIIKIDIQWKSLILIKKWRSSKD